MGGFPVSPDNSLLPTPPQENGPTDATMEMLAANGAVPSTPQASPNKPGALKSLLMNMARGASLAAGYESGIPQAQALQQNTAESRALQPYKIQQAQAQANLTQAQAEQMRTMVDTPYGQMPLAYWKSIAPALIRSGASTANTNAKISSQEKLAQQAIIQKMQGLGYDTTFDENGKASFTPIDQSKLSPVMQAKLSPKENLNQWIATIQNPQASPTDKQLAQSKLNQLQTYQTGLNLARGQGYGIGRAENTPFATFDSEGNLTTTTVADAIKNGYPSAQVWNQVFGPTGATKTQGQAAGAVAQHIPDFESAVRNLSAKGELGPVMGRLNTYLTEGYGGNDPDVANFITTVGLLKSGAVRAHFGARGGQQILAKFDNLLNTSQEPNALIGSAEAIKTFLNTYKATGTANPKATGGASNSKPTGGTPNPPNQNTGGSFWNNIPGAVPK